MRFVVPAPETVSVPIEGGNGDRFPVRRIYCVGRNYAAHAREMGADPDREPPFFFTKPAGAIEPDGAAIPYPPRTKDFHYEIELVVAIGKGGRDIAVEDALAHVFGYATGIDLTRRDLQLEAREQGRPWDMGKAFDRSAPCGPLLPAGSFDPGRGVISLSVNGAVKQESDLSKLIWSVPEIIAHLSSYVELAPGDLIFTGTPDKVGAIVPGDAVVGHIDGLSDLRISVTE